MSAPRITRDSADVREAWESATSLRQFCTKLGISYNVTAAARLCEGAGLAYPGPHWGWQPTPQPAIPDPAEQVERDTELQRVKGERDELRRKYTASLREANLYKDLMELGREVMGKVTPTTVKPPRASKSKTVEDAILGWADWHFDERVDYDVMQGYNAYDPVVACRRAQYTVDDTIDTLFGVHTGTTFERLWVFDLGDSVTGDLLDENKATNSLGTMRAMVLVARLRARALTELSAFLPVVYIAVPGNHPRRAPKMQWKLPTENGDWLIAEWISDLCRDNDRVQVVVPKAWTAGVTIRGWNHSLNHGYSAARGGYGGIPWYSFQRTDGKLTALESAHGQRVHYRWYGHIHQKSELPMMDGEGDQFVVGSLMGGNEYALGGLSAYADPVQKLVGCHDRHGVSWRQPLNVKHADDTPSRYEDLLG